MCKEANSNQEGEVHFLSRKNKSQRIVYLSQRTLKLATTFINSNGLNDGEKLFDKPDKNLQKNLRKYIYSHIDEPVQLHDFRASKATHLYKTGQFSLVDL